MRSSLECISFVVFTLQLSNQFICPTENGKCNMNNSSLGFFLPSDSRAFVWLVFLLLSSRRWFGAVKTGGSFKVSVWKKVHILQ